MSEIFKRVKAPDIEDLLVNAWLIAQGSVEQAVKGKHYNWALQLFKLTYESLARLLINEAMQQGDSTPDTLQPFINIIKDTRWQIYKIVATI